MQSFAYPIALTKDADAGGYIVSCRDLPEVVTQGESADEALDEAAGALQAAVEMRIEDRLDIPAPSALKRREHLVILPVTTAIKAALYLTMREQGVTKSDLARLLQLDEKEARRILDPKHGTKVNTMERALRMLGKRVEVLVS
jgi:antitoxin HicB